MISLKKAGTKIPYFQQHHESNDKSVECTTSRTKRWAFTILDSCCPVVGIPIVPGQHVPLEYDVEVSRNYQPLSILVFSDSKVKGMNRQF